MGYCRKFVAELVHGLYSCARFRWISSLVEWQGDKAPALLRSVHQTCVLFLPNHEGRKRSMRLLP